MIKEVIVVEGKQDIHAVRRAVDAECIATGGFTLAPKTIKQIDCAYAKRGIIILTDPDSAGERIRKYLGIRYPGAKHAFVPRQEATDGSDIGIEQAGAESIRSALAKVRYREFELGQEFTWTDIIRTQLTGSANSSQRRAALGEYLGIGYANAKTFLYRLNCYGVSRSEFDQAVAELLEQHAKMEEKHDTADDC